MLVHIARDREEDWSRDELDALLDDGLVVLGLVDGAVAAVLGLSSHDVRDDAARVALLWETRPFEHGLMTAVIERGAELCRERGLVAMAAEVDEEQSADVELFTGLGFAVIEHVERRPATNEELAWMGGAPGAMLAGFTLLEYAV